MTAHRKNADPNVVAHAIVAQATGDQPRTERKVGNVWVESGREGGRRRAERLSPERRREIAMMGVEARRSAKKGSQPVPAANSPRSALGVT